ncbi:pleckstrin homology domain-containing family S member 1-like [Cololabis saira]|uniref:pleckstrin homology domain-containing family S member 1-like n=1 Tax=Cololabis saira TaxID=129043 RepID=UPI002AD45EC5|nr:pleckstrin homology domain-containing family S member 1-like [Cololabis saira]
MQKSNRNSGGAVFYKSLTDTTEVRCGYLYKSPSKQLRTEKSWKRRYFVLVKVNEQQHQLWYFRSPEEKDKPLGSIDLAKVSKLYVNPQGHPKWEWVQRTLKCSSSCVLFLSTENREYFLVGETSEEVESWFCDLFDALKHRPHQCHNAEQKKKGQSAAPVISSPRAQEKKSPEVTKDLVVKIGEAGSKHFLPPPPTKIRSISDPPSKSVDYDPEKRKAILFDFPIGRQEEDDAQRRASAPSQPIYDHPRSYLKSNVGENSRGRSLSMGTSMEPLYITMKGNDEYAAQKVECEDAEGDKGTIMRSVTYVFDTYKIGTPPLSTNGGDMATDDREEKRQSSELSSCSSDYASPEELEKQNSTESLDLSAAEERDLEVKQADLKKHLTLTDKDGKPSVSAWTGQPQTECLFHKGDQILALNDLHTGSVEDFNLYISRSLKNEVKVTILRRPGCQPLHWPNCPCTG